MTWSSTRISSSRWCGDHYGGRFFPLQCDLSGVKSHVCVWTVEGISIVPGTSNDTGSHQLFFLFATVPAKKPYFMQVHHVHTATPCLSPYPQLYAQLTVVTQLSFSPRFRTGCSAYLLDFGVQYFPLICVFVPIMIVMEPPLNMTGPNSQTPQVGVRKVFHLVIVVFKVLSLSLWERKVLIVRDFVSTLTCHDRSKWYRKRCAR